MNTLVWYYDFVFGARLFVVDQKGQLVSTMCMPTDDAIAVAADLINKYSCHNVYTNNTIIQQRQDELNSFLKTNYSLDTNANTITIEVK